MRSIALTFFIALAAAAQTPVAPSPDFAGDEHSDSVSSYSIADSFETGYRFDTVGGNLSQYRSSVNFSDGIRLFGSSLVINSKDGHGRLFDHISLTTQGLGNDPYESASLRIEENRLYQYDMTWRLNDYFNPGLVTAGGGGENLFDTQYRSQDHNLTLFPQSNLKFFVGMSSNSETGPAYSSTQLFDSSGTIVPLFSNVRRTWREYRLGNEFRVLGIRVNWMHGWEDFKDDTGAALATSGVPGAAPLLPVAGVTANSFQASNPYHGTSPYWRASLFTDRKIFNVNGRFTYTAGKRAFVDDQSAVGIAASLQRSQNVITFGNADRPVATGNLNLIFTPNTKLTISNNSSVYNVRTLGDSFFQQVDTVSGATTILFYNYLGIRTLSNDTTLNYQITPVLGFVAGYHYSNRLIQSNEEFTVTETTSSTPASQTDQFHSGDVGIRVKPLKPLTILISAEVGTNSRPFTPRAERDFHILNGRVQYHLRRFQLAAAANANYNVNSISISSYSSQSRSYSVNGNWTPAAGWFSLDAEWSRIHTYTIGGIAYFLNQDLTQGQDSIYLSNVESIYAGVRFAFKQRVGLYLGYTRVQDLGDGRSDPTGAGIGSPLTLFQSVQTFPVTFESPLARLSVRISAKLRWNVGYQYYGYRQVFTSLQNYRANTGYSSFSVSF